MTALINPVPGISPAYLQRLWWRAAVLRPDQTPGSVTGSRTVLLASKLSSLDLLFGVPFVSVDAGYSNLMVEFKCWHCEVPPAAVGALEAVLNAIAGHAGSLFRSFFGNDDTRFTWYATSYCRDPGRAAWRLYTYLTEQKTSDPLPELS